MAVYIIILFILGVFFGAVVVAAVYFIVSKSSGTKVDTVTESLKSSFGDISRDALLKTTDYMIRTASEKLSGERALSLKDIESERRQVEMRIEGMNREVAKLTELISTLEGKRNNQLGELRTAIDATQERTRELYFVTNTLKDTLSSKQARGQWGERMAADILTFAGLQEGVTYLRQTKDNITGNIPDYTFLLPNGLKINMDVKFPFENYQKFIEAPDNEKERLRSAFIKDVKLHIKAVAGRDYINPESNTLDWAIIFIPNEQIYSFIFEADHSVLEDAVENKIMLCSPVTILTVLSIIRQATDNFTMEKRAKELLTAVKTFGKEWASYSEGFVKLGSAIEQVASEYQKLSSTRSNKLEKSLGKLEDSYIIDDKLNDE